MRTIEMNLYSPAELKESYPEGYDHAFSHWQQDQYDFGCNWGDEIMESLKAIFDKSGIDLTNWEIDGNGGYSTVKFSVDDTVFDLQGQRAVAWLENNLLGQFRIPFLPFTDKKRTEFSKYGLYYRPGLIKPAPFTGCCFDEDYIESLQKDIKAGCTIGESYRNLARVAAKLFDGEWTYQTSEENFLESDLEYTEEGRLM